MAAGTDADVSHVSAPLDAPSTAPKDDAEPPTAVSNTVSAASSSRMAPRPSVFCRSPRSPRRRAIDTHEVMLSSLSKEVTALEWRLQTRVDALDRRVEEAGAPRDLGSDAAQDAKAIAAAEVHALGERLKRHFEARFLPLEATADTLAEVAAERVALRGRLAELADRLASVEDRLEEALEAARLARAAAARPPPRPEEGREPAEEPEMAIPKPLVHVPRLPLGAAVGSDKAPKPPPHWVVPPANGRRPRRLSNCSDSSRSSATPVFISGGEEAGRSSVATPVFISGCEDTLSPPAGSHLSLDLAALAAEPQVLCRNASAVSREVYEELTPCSGSPEPHRLVRMLAVPENEEQTAEGATAVASIDPLALSAPVDDSNLGVSSRRSSQVKHVMHQLGTVSRSSAKYSLKESVWDASLFIGHSSLGVLTNLLLFVSVVLNLAIQGCLCVIVLFEFSTASYTEDLVIDIGRWVAGVGAEVRQRVCELDPTLSTDTYQMGLYDHVLSFTRIRILNLETGPLLSTLVIFMWTLSVSDNIRGCFDFLVSTHQMSKTIIARETIISAEGDKFYLEGITKRRLCSAIISGVLQIVIAVILLGSGALWLVYTRSITDLILNAVALSYIMQVDELLYNVMVPRKVKALVRNMEPLSLGNRLTPAHWGKGVPRRATITCALVILFTTATFFYYIVPNAVQVRQLRDTLCDPPA